VRASSCGGRAQACGGFYGERERCQQEWVAPLCCSGVTCLLQQQCVFRRCIPAATTVCLGGAYLLRQQCVFRTCMPAATRVGCAAVPVQQVALFSAGAAVHSRCCRSLQVPLFTAGAAVPVQQVLPFTAGAAVHSRCRCAPGAAVPVQQVLLFSRCCCSAGATVQQVLLFSRCYCSAGATVHSRCRCSQLVLQCLFSRCCRSQQVLPFTAGAAVHCRCRCSQQVPLFTAGAAVPVQQVPTCLVMGPGCSGAAAAAAAALPGA